MKAIVTLEQRFYEFDGCLYTSGSFARSFWDRYLGVFDQVVIVARAQKMERLDPKLVKVSDEKVTYFALPYYVGIKQALQARREMKKALERLLREVRGAYILRVGSPIADILAPLLQGRSMEYAVEVVGDPWDVFAPGAVNHPLRPFLRRYFAAKLKWQCANASFCSYVTERALQLRYPPKKALATTHASSIDLREGFFAKERQFDDQNDNWVFTGTLEQLQKAPDILLKAFKLVLHKKPNAKLSLIGDGRERPALEKMAEELKISENVRFVGHLSSPDLVREVLLDNPFFVLPSRGEGLPRAMIEAMACGCVCVGSDIGGMRELIPEEWITPVGHSKELANTMLKAMDMNREGKRLVSQRNQKQAKKYLKPVLDERRRRFYQEIRSRLERREACA